jgi:hypothetical protein
LAGARPDFSVVIQTGTAGPAVSWVKKRSWGVTVEVMVPSFVAVRSGSIDSV